MASAIEEKEAARVLRKANTSAVRYSNCNCPTSSLERSSSRFTSRSRRWALRCIMLNSFDGMRSPCVRSGPRIKLSGVRNSWEMFAKKRDFTKSSALIWLASICAFSAFLASSLARTWAILLEQMEAIVFNASTWKGVKKFLSGCSESITPITLPWIFSGTANSERRASSSTI